MISKFVVLLCAAAAVQSFSLGQTDVVFHLFTRTNPTASQPLLPDPNIIAQSSFSTARRTIFTIHSYGETVAGNFNAFVVKAHLDTEDVNVVAIDWSQGSSVYTLGLANAPQVGEIISRFINILTENFGYTTNQVRIVGVGLGGHIAGIAARKTRGEIPHIIALDPSLVGWTHHPDKLHPDDAVIVEVLYATAGDYGYDYPLGDLNFFANGGRRQTGCGTDIMCSHIYSYAFYAESITTEIKDEARFVGTSCENHEQAMDLRCTGSDRAIFGGTATKTDVTGIFTFLTNPLPPFARG